MYKKIITYIKEKYHCTVKTCWIADMKERCGLPVRMGAIHMIVVVLLQV